MSNQNKKLSQEYCFKMNSNQCFIMKDFELTDKRPFQDGRIAQHKKRWKRANCM
jgi:hypothetical protein